jgi:branched-chain amino acid transport system ATP-binding protein
MALLEFRNIAKSFGGLPAIKDVSFKIDEGEIVGLIGPNGAGKTTLFAMASGFLRPTSGHILFDNARIDQMSAPQICRRGLVRTFQIVRPFGDMTVLENVAIGAFLRHPARADAERVALAVLKQVGLVDRAEDMARTLTLAGRKRLEVAKALATQPRLLMLDEVMAGLTSVETEGMLALLRDLRGAGLTILLIEHNMHAVMSVSDRVVVVHHGQKIGDGSPQSIVSDKDVIAAYLGEGDD